MAKYPPYYPWYPADFLNSRRVKRLSFEAKGFYRDLLDYSWIYEHLPANPDSLAELLGKDRRTCRRLLGEVSEFFQKVGENLYNERLEQERKKLNEISNKRKGAIQKRWAKTDTNVLQMKYYSESESESDKDLNTLASNDKKTIVPKPPKIKFELSTATFQNITPEDIAKWAAAYPAVNIEAQILRAALWLQTNPSKAKKNYGRFLVNWFARAQEKGGDIESKKISPKITAPKPTVPEYAKLDPEEVKRRQQLAAENLAKITGRGNFNG